MSVWLVFHPGWEDAVAVFSTYERARVAYPQGACQFVQYMVNPHRIFDLPDDR